MSAPRFVIPWILCSVVSLIVLRLKLLTFWDLNVSFGKSTKLLRLLSILVFMAKNNAVYREGGRGILSCS